MNDVVLMQILNAKEDARAEKLDVLLLDALASTGLVAYGIEQVAAWAILNSKVHSFFAFKVEFVPHDERVAQFPQNLAFVNESFDDLSRFRFLN